MPGPGNNDMKAPAWARTSDSETLPVTGASDSEVPVPLGAQRIINPSHHDPGTAVARARAGSDSAPRAGGRRLIVIVKIITE